MLFGGAWRSLVAHLLWEQGVGGSNPLAPTIAIFSEDLPCGYLIRPEGRKWINTLEKESEPAGGG